MNVFPFFRFATVDVVGCSSPDSNLNRLLVSKPKTTPLFASRFFDVETPVPHHMLCEVFVFDRTDHFELPRWLIG